MTVRSVCADLFIIFTLGLVIAFELPKATRLLFLEVPYRLGPFNIESLSPRLWLVVHWIVSILNLCMASARYAIGFETQTSRALHTIFQFLVLLNCGNLGSGPIFVSVAINVMAVAALELLYDNHVFYYICFLSAPIWMQFGIFVVACMSQYI